MERKIDNYYPIWYKISIMKNLKLAHLLRKYSDGWVSISKDYRKVLASGKTMKIVLSKLQRLGNPDGILMRAAKDYSRYAGYTSESTH